MELTPAQRTAVAVTLRLLEKSMDHIELLLTRPLSGALYRQVDDLTDLQHRELLYRCREVRQRLIGLAQGIGLHPQEEPLRQTIAALLARAWADVEDVRPAKLSRYGAVDPRGADQLDIALSQISTQIQDMERLLQTGGTESTQEVSAGGVVFIAGQVLLLQKANGEWVMPKGHIEAGERPEEAARREVAEEAGIRASILGPVGTTRYQFQRVGSDQRVDKIVYWFAMSSNDQVTHPADPFIAAALATPDDALHRLTYDNDRDILRKALADYGPRVL